MTMDMHRGGLRVEAASLAAGTKPTTASPASSEASASSDRTGSPGTSPSGSPSLIHHHSSNNNKSPPPLQTSNKMSIKRSFDVAFLMAPDDLSTIKKRHQEQEQQLRLVTTASLMMRSAMTPLNVAITPPQPSEGQQQRILQQHPPSLMVMGQGLHGLHDDQARSAFTKVASSSTPIGHMGSMLLMQNPPLPTSPSSVSSAGGLSPAYQNSLSPSPGPASTPTPGAGSPPYGVGYPQQPPYGAPPFYVPQSPHGPPGPVGPHVGAPPPASSPSPQGLGEKQGGRAPPPRRYTPPANGAPGAPFPFGAAAYGKPPEFFHKLRPSPGVGPPAMLYPDSLAAYTNLAAAAAAASAGYPFGSAPAPAAPSAGSALAAAAVVSASLMPPTLAALSLPAQNVCAKCNVSFRMTSDLVYHMRAHHKSDNAVNDPTRRRREQDKLKCPVCAESFRERHHLTRHMTAHQDKEGDVHEDAELQVELASGSSGKTSPSSARRRPVPGVAPQAVPAHGGPPLTLAGVAK